MIPILLYCIQLYFWVIVQLIWTLAAECALHVFRKVYVWYLYFIW
jgi:hypothetical protein